MKALFNKSTPALDIIGIVLMIGSLLTAYFYDSLLITSKFTLHFPILVSLFLIFFRRVTLFQAGLISWLAFALWWIDFVEGYTHGIIRDIGFFRLINYPETIVNVTIFIYYYLILLGLGIVVISKKRRTPERTFSFLSSLAVLTVSWFIHDAIPRSTFAWNEILVERVLASAIKTSPEDNIPRICKEYEIACEFNVKPNAIGEVFKSSVQISKLESIFREINLTEKESASFIIFRSEGDEGVREVFFVRKNKQNLFDVFIETKLMAESEKVHENAFSKLLIVANFVWGWLFLIIGIMHTKPLRKKVWIES